MSELTRLNSQVRIKHGDLSLRELGLNVDLQVIDDKMKLASGLNQRIVATATVDQEVDLADYGITNGRFLYVDSDQNISIKLNLNTNAAIPITKPTDDPVGQTTDTNVKRVGFILLLTDSLTKIFISNASGNSATVRFAVAAQENNA